MTKTLLLLLALGTTAFVCDDDCAPDDPICIPCDLDALQVRQCRLECITDPYGVTICRQVCNGVGQ